MFVTDKVLLECGVATKVTAELDKAGIAYEIYSDVKPNPTVANVQTGVAKFKEMGADSLVAVGGGSVMDTAKAVGIIIANPDFADVVSLEGVADTKNKSVPLIALPTTSGTAAEVTINYVITDEANKKEDGLRRSQGYSRSSYRRQRSHDGYAKGSVCVYRYGRTDTRYRRIYHKGCVGAVRYG